MIRTRRTAPAAALLLAAPPATGSVPAAADPVPGGPFVCGNQPIQLNGLHSNAELECEPQRLAAQHPDTVTLEEVGRSVDGRPLHLASVVPASAPCSWSPSSTGSSRWAPRPRCSC